MFTVKFWKDAGERAVRAFASALLAVAGVSVTSLASIPWEADLSAAGGAAVISLLTSIVASTTTKDPTTASLVNNAKTGA